MTTNNEDKALEILRPTAEAIIQALGDRDMIVDHFKTQAELLTRQLEASAGQVDKLQAALAAKETDTAAPSGPPPAESGDLGSSENFALTPSMIQGAKRNPATGFYESAGDWRSNIFALGFRVPACAYDKTLVVEYDVAASLNTDGKNIKIIRGWDSAMTSPTQGKCNVYLGQNTDGWKKLFTEGSSIPASVQTTKFSFPGEVVRRERYEIKFPSGPGRMDGAIRRSINGRVEFDRTGWQFDTDDKPGVQQFWFIQMDYSPSKSDTGPFPADNWIRVKPLFVGIA